MARSVSLLPAVTLLSGVLCNVLWLFGVVTGAANRRGSGLAPEVVIKDVLDQWRSAVKPAGPEKRRLKRIFCKAYLQA